MSQKRKYGKSLQSIKEKMHCHTSCEYYNNDRNIGIQNKIYFYLKGIVLVYFIAFVSVYSQLQGLYGQHGILPAHRLLKCRNDILQCFAERPTLAWFAPFVKLDVQHMLEFISLAAIVWCICVICVSTHAPGMMTMTVLWISYLSLVNIGQIFMRFQWDQLLLEAGFLSIFVSSLSSSDGAGSRSIIAMELVRWLMFRLMFASGVVKLTSGCSLWWSLNALPVHYESQCLPTRPAWWLYQLPKGIHQFSVIITFVTEIALPFLFYAPFKRLRRIASYGQILLMLMIIITGNYNFFNILTIVLALSVVDDEFFLPVKLRSECNHVRLISAVCVGSLGIMVPCFFPMTIHDDWSVEFEVGFSYSQFVDFVHYATIASILLGAGSLLLAIWKQILEYSNYSKNFIFSVLAMLLFLLSLPSYSTINSEVHQSIWPELHKFSDKVSSFNIVGSYGLFRRMTGADGRPELILEGADRFGGPWQELEFKFKPGNVGKPNKFAAYLQPRLDWQMWFAALSNYQHNPWLMSLIYRILTGENEVYRLMDIENFSDYSPAKPPKYVRGTLYIYRFAPIRNDTIALPDIWWERDIDSEYLPPLSVNDGFLLAYLKQIETIGKEDSPPKSTPLSKFLDLVWLFMQTELLGITILMWGYYFMLIYICGNIWYLTYRYDT